MENSEIPKISGLEAFLETLPLEEIGRRDRIMVMIAKSNDDYMLHCFVLGQLTEQELEGEPVKGLWKQWLFSNIMLPTFSAVIETVLDSAGVLYHRSPPLPPTVKQDIVTYKLLHRQEDPEGRKLFEYATSLLHSLQRLL